MIAELQVSALKNNIEKATDLNFKSVAFLYVKKYYNELILIV